MRLEFTYQPADLKEFTTATFLKTLKGDAGTRSFRFRAGLLGWLIFIGLAVLLIMLARAERGTTPASQPVASVEQPVHFSQLVLSLLPWLLIFGLIWFFLFRQLRGGAAWARNKSLHHPHVLEMTEDGIDLESPTGLLRWKWHAVTGGSNRPLSSSFAISMTSR